MEEATVSERVYDGRQKIIQGGEKFYFVRHIGQ